MRNRRIAKIVGAAVLVVAVGTGGAYGIGQLLSDDSAAATTSADPASASPTQRSEELAEAPTLAPSSTPTVTPAPTTTPEPEETEPPEPEPLFDAGDTGDDIRELQARLKQLRWYEPDISGEYDDITTASVAGFQVKRELPETGVVDEDTWDRLVAMTRKPTDDELHNRIVAGPPILSPGDSGDRVRELQARLKQIGWFTGEVTPNYGDVTRVAVAGFQVKRELPETGAVDQDTWDRLAAMTRKPTEDELHNREPDEDEPDDTTTTPVAGLDPRCTTGRALCIDKTSRSLRWVVDGQVKTTLDVRFGSELTPTREGAFKVGWKSRDHVSSLYDTPMPYAMFFSGGQAVHYSPDFAQNGYNGASHGCVNVRDKGAIASLFDQVKVGDKVIVYHS
ncbi:L,D-transpeptidase family protein [Phytoactinopolyspora limicola]|uniref:L,D-transpeptidase family protein n=1 Tax=Phytoactinopolyspora limicola TaxID=2715536 RepID=UPI001A9C3144|nr:peptidoglycan-binding protein [Phytoactinopolyspora limicola]